MHNLLFLLPNLDYSSLARQATLVASLLPKDRFVIQLLSLSGSGAFEDVPAQHGIPCFIPEKVRWGSWEAIRLLRRVMRNDPPDVIHCWGLSALRCLWWAGWGSFRKPPRVVVSLPLSGMSHRSWGWWTRRLLHRASKIVAADDSARQHALNQGLAGEKVRVIVPGVTLPPDANLDPRPTIGLPSGARTILGIGEMDTSQRAIEFFWASAILNVADPEVYFVGIGTGTARERYDAATRRVMRDPGKLWLPGSRRDAVAFLPTAEVVWVVPRQSGGTYAVLEGMAAGRTVVATRLPHLKALIHDGETGCLVPPREPTTIARVTYQLIQDPTRRQRIGDAAQAIVRDRFGAEAMVAHFAELYDDVA